MLDFKSRRNIGIALIVLILLGSFINFYVTNFIMSDVSNLTFGFGNRPIYITASLPGLNIAFIFVLVTIFLVRYLRRPQYKKRLLRLYTIIGMCFSLIGLISSIVAGLMVYKSFTSPNPFPGYLIICIVLFSLLLISGILFFIFCYPKIENDKEKREMKVSYVLYSIVFSITTYYAFNRFGALLWLPSYFDGPTGYMTWFFYFGLILPIIMFAHTIMYAFNFYKKHNGIALIVISVVTALFIATEIYAFCLGMANSQFISVISPAMAASRLLAKPIDFILNLVVFGILDVYALIHSIRYYKKHKIVTPKD